jgi:hypothetical protein
VKTAAAQRENRGGTVHAKTAAARCLRNPRRHGARENRGGTVHAKTAAA